MDGVVERAQFRANQHARDHVIAVGFDEGDPFQFGKRHSHQADFLKRRHLLHPSRRFLSDRQNLSAADRPYAASTPHHSATNSAMVLVAFRKDSRSTYSLNPCIAAPDAPKHRLGML